MVLSFGKVCLLLLLTAANFNIIVQTKNRVRDRYYFFAFAAALMQLSLIFTVYG